MTNIEFKALQTDPMFQAQCAAEWDAWNQYREYSIWPRHHMPLTPRPNGIDPFTDDGDWY